MLVVFQLPFYAPVSFPPLPLVVLKRAADDAAPAVAAVGSLKTIDPDRIILKRVILTGYVLHSIFVRTCHLTMTLYITCFLW